MQGKQFVYVDESAFAPTAERTHGFARKGKRVHGQRSGQRRPRTSFLAALCGKQMLAPFLFQGTCNTAVFNAWLEQELCPHLTPNSVVIMDNATFHKSTLTQQLIQQRQATLLFLPPYSPDLNPIEKRFDTIKRYRSYTPEISLNLLIQTYG